MYYMEPWMMSFEVDTCDLYEIGSGVMDLGTREVALFKLHITLGLDACD